MRGNRWLLFPIFRGNSSHHMFAISILYLDLSILDLVSLQLETLELQSGCLYSGHAEHYDHQQLKQTQIERNWVRAFPELQLPWGVHATSENVVSVWLIGKSTTNTNLWKFCFLKHCCSWVCRFSLSIKAKKQKQKTIDETFICTCVDSPSQLSQVSLRQLMLDSVHVRKKELLTTLQSFVR